ncbi:MAG TPA: benzoyl-CoA 2,3-epoxidase subunit BoxB [Pseudomonadota bacterium]|jgi:benzoyl-CoA 2,3-dioxygenase component B|nr:benzoyl-CoA 2,3-epoxidase subunit BoxB [Pseudomonadota bacterium]HNF99127.1 benzoyl-CoA 2,3-epoxidase subunit BoxB [Pseudomonadota bacterium]HNK43215.1 benzoyl-CoA 2,3-epoxidase subunit BoxB [Pseudomonadota bacterium]
MTVELFEKIPNNVNLSADKRLQRALEQWLPNYISWWKEMGPDQFQESDVYLRTAISVETDGWAHFDYVRMPEYRWGIFLEPAIAGRTIGFGDHYGQPAWQEVPGEYRNTLRRIIVTQGDTEPASVEQQRMLGHTAPSLYDLRNLFQVNVEEGRHLWAMVYLLHSYFGKDGREEAEAMLERRSGDRDKPRILGAFNEPVKSWLDFYMFTMFTDRDGKFQLCALSESGFDPLSRTCKFMLTEEAHHMFVGETGVDRVVQRACELMLETRSDSPDVITKAGGIPLDMVQRHLNLWFSLSEDLFGGEISSNAAEFFAAGLKGRYKEDSYSEHTGLNQFYEMPVPAEGGKIVTTQVPLRNAMNEVLRDGYVTDCQRAVDKWNRTIDKQLGERGAQFKLALPSRRFHRHIGIYGMNSGNYFDPTGNPISQGEFMANRNKWLPTDADREYLKQIMRPVTEPGKIAAWIAPPARGINGQTVEFEYVRHLPA